MKVGQRNLNFLFLFDYRHYLSFFNIFKYCKRPFDFLNRYFKAKGNYPCRIGIRTPLQLVFPEIYSYDDSLTINEIFFRLDYRANKGIHVFVDIGANIGISALYFLTRNSYVRGYLFEPISSNIIKLNKNLNEYSDRYINEKVAIYTKNEIRNFSFETSGRLGGLHRLFNNKIQVTCVSINNILKDILGKESFIDILKIDIEGDELEVVKFIKPEYLSKIRIIYFDIDYTVNISNDYKIFPEFFNESRYGNTYIMKAKNLQKKFEKQIILEES